MMDMWRFTYLVSAALLLFIEKGLCIRCYSCNSAPGKHDALCIDEVHKDLGIDCDILNKNYTKCRKIYQEVDGESRIIRQCATLGNDDCKTRTGTKDIKIEYCQCSSDFCNHGNKALGNLLFVAGAVVMSSILMLRR